MAVWRLSLLIIVLIVAIIFLQYRLWFQPGGLSDVLALKRQIAIREQDNQKLKKANEDLLFQIKRLQNSQDNTEARARSELGMIKKDETFYQVIDKQRKR